jgi:hypothetical protein
MNNLLRLKTTWAMHLRFVAGGAIAFIHAFAAGQQNAGRLPVQDGVALLETIDAANKTRVLLFDSCDPGVRLDPRVADMPGGQRTNARLNDVGGVIRNTVAWRVSGWKVGGHPIPDAWVVEDNLSVLRQFSGIKFTGIIGLRSLGNCVVGLDFDKLTVYLADNKSPQFRESLPLYWVEDNPCVRVEVEGEKIEFAIATGSNGTLSLPSTLFQKLVEKKVIELADIDDAGSAAPTGLSHERTGWFLKGLLMGRNLGGVNVDEGGEMGEIGLQWLRAFNVELSTKHMEMTYEIRQSPSEPVDWQAMLGANFEFEGAGPVVWGVRKGGGAELAGLRKGDKLVSFDGIPAANLNIDNIAEHVAAKADQNLPCVLEKSGSGQITPISIRLGRFQSQWSSGGRTSK